MVNSERVCSKSMYGEKRQGNFGISETISNALGTDALLTVLANVTNDTKLVKVTSSSLGPERLLERDLHVADKVLVETALQPDVSEPQQQDVLDHLLSEVMVDPVRLVLGPLFLQRRHHLATRVSVLAKGLFDDDPVGTLGRVTVLLQSLGDDREHARGQGHVEQSVRLLDASLGLDLFQLLQQGLETRVLVVLSGDVGRDAGKLVELLLVGVLVRLRSVVTGSLDVANLSRVEVVVAHLCVEVSKSDKGFVQRRFGSSCPLRQIALTRPGISDDVQIFRQVTLLEEVEEGREGLSR